MVLRSFIVACFLFTGFVLPAEAQTGKPGERLIYDDRVPEAPQLQKRIFEKPKTLKRQKTEETVEAPQDEDIPLDNAENNEADSNDNQQRPSDLIVRPDSGSQQEQTSEGMNEERPLSELSDEEMTERLRREEAQMLRELGNNDRRDTTDRERGNRNSERAPTEREAQRLLDESGAETSREINKQIQETIRNRTQNQE